MSHRASPPDTTLRGRWFLLVRLTWLAVAAILIGLNAAGLPYSDAKYKSVCASAACAYPEGTTRGITLLTPESVRTLRDIGLSPEFYDAYIGVVAPVVAVLVFAAVAGVISRYKAEDRMALFSAFVLLTFGGAGLNSDVLEAAATAQPAL